MRRRQMYAQRSPDNAMVQAFAEAFGLVAVPKGACPKCKKHIGRGIQFHIKACNGDLRRDADEHQDPAGAG